MERKKIQTLFQDEESHLAGAICDDIELCQQKDYPVYSVFYPPHIVKKICEINIDGVNVTFLGLKELCEKKMIAFYPTSVGENELFFPVKFFRVENKSKFKSLEHKDYLGAILSLGIKRELLGDLIIDDNYCYGIATEEVFDLIALNLTSVGKNPVEVQEIEREEVPELKYENVIDTVSSLRLDNIVPILIKNSRSFSLNIIQNGEVKVNYEIEKSKNKVLKTGDVITIKKIGKFILYELLGKTKKDKIKVFIKKFI